MLKFFSIGLIVATVLVASTDNAIARGRRFRRSYSYRPVPAATTAASPSTSTQANRQAVRRYSYAPSGSSYRSAQSTRSGGSYGPQNWRADRKVMGY
jgi:hypothetical protein